MKALSVIVFISMISLPGFIQAQVDLPTSDDLAAAESEASQGASFRRKQDLHSWPVAFPDGAKGYSIVSRTGTFVYGLNTTAKDESDESVHQLFCQASAIVLARNLGSTAHLTNSKAFIFTRSRFEIEEVLKSSPDMRANGTLAVLREGGEVADNGELLRIEYLLRPDYAQNAEYVLFLTRHKTLPMKDYFSGGPVILVKNGQVTFERGDWQQYFSGMRYIDFRSDLQRIAKLKACN